MPAVETASGLSMASLAPWQWWIAISATLLVIEMLTTSFFALFFALGAVGSAIFSALLGPSLAWELGLFLLASLASLGAFRPLCQQWFKVGKAPSQPSNVDALLGQEAIAKTAVTPDGGTVQVRHTGEVWSAYSTNGEIAAQSKVVIEKVDGAKLVVGQP